MQNPNQFAVESTYNWYWLVDGLEEAGYKLHLTNPSAIQQYEGLKHTDDKWDSFWLAHMLRLGILPEGYIYPKKNNGRYAIFTKTIVLRSKKNFSYPKFSKYVHPPLGW